MSEPHGDGEGAGSAASDSGEPIVSPPAAAPPYRGVAITLAAALLLLAALAGTAPFWAPSLPWAPPATAPRTDRIDQIDRTLQQIRRDEAGAATARRALAQRVTGLEAKSAAPAADLADLRQQVTKLSSAATELAARVEALDTAAHREAAAASSDAAIALVLLQIRDALVSGRPFTAAYDALTRLLKKRPEVADAAAPLATPAKNGVASRAVLLARLRQLAPAIAAAQASDGSPPPGPAPQTSESKAASWGDALLDRLRSLVRIRRADHGTGRGGENSGSSGVAAAAEQAVTADDLAGAIAALDKLDGDAAAAARPWLAMAKQRLAAENALRHLETALVAQRAPPGDAAKAAGPASGKASGQ